MHRVKRMKIYMYALGGPSGYRRNRVHSRLHTGKDPLMNAATRPGLSRQELSDVSFRYNAITFF